MTAHLHPMKGVSNHVKEKVLQEINGFCNQQKTSNNNRRGKDEAA